MSPRHAAVRGRHARVVVRRDPAQVFAALLLVVLVIVLVVAALGALVLLAPTGGV